MLLSRSMADTPAIVQRWRRGMVAAEQRARALAATEAGRPAKAVGEALAALAALEAMGRWPGPRDAVSEQAVRVVRARWARIQRRAKAAARAK